MMFFLGFIFFILLVVIHEYGHFLVAKRNGVEVEEFGIGFPPKLVGKKMGKGIFESYYTINLLPLGGFVRLKGENDADTRKGSFGAASMGAKARIILAGVLMNFLAAIVIFTGLAWVGMPQLLPDQYSVESDSTLIRDDLLFAFIEEGSPADKAGLKIPDQIVSIGGEQVVDSENLFNLTESLKEEIVDVEYIKAGEDQITTVPVDLNEHNDKDGYFGATFTQEGETVVLSYVEPDSPADKAGLGATDSIVRFNGEYVSSSDALTGLSFDFRGKDIEIVYKRVAETGNSKATISLNEESDRNGALGANTAEIQQKRYTWSAPIVGVGTTVQFSVETLKGLGGIFADLFAGNFSEASEDVSGPVGVVVILQGAGTFGFTYLMSLIGIISLTLAVMNALPIPALDGGRLAVTALFKFLKKPLTPNKEQWIHGTGFAILLGLILLITIVDVDRFF